MAPRNWAIIVMPVWFLETGLIVMWACPISSAPSLHSKVSQKASHKCWYRAANRKRPIRVRGEARDMPKSAWRRHFYCGGRTAISLLSKNDVIIHAWHVPYDHIRECMRVQNMHYVLQEQASRKLERASNITSLKHKSGSSHWLGLLETKPISVRYSGNNCHISLVPKPLLVFTLHFIFNIVSAIWRVRNGGEHKPKRKKLTNEQKTRGGPGTRLLPYHAYMHPTW